MDLNNQHQFFTQLSLLFRAGVPLTKALEILSEAKAEFSKDAERIFVSIVRGHDLTEAFSGSFSGIVLALLKVGQKSGRLDVVLERLGLRAERLTNLRSSLLASLMYPIGILLVSGLAAGSIVIVMLPNLLPFVTELGVELPWPTKLLVFIDNWKWLLLNLIFLPLSLLALVMRINPDLLQELKHLVKERVPVISKLTRSCALSDSAADLGLGLSAGIGILETLEVTAEACSSREVGESFLEMAARLKNGASMDEAVQDLPALGSLFPSIFVVGEETGKLAEMLLSAAIALEQDSEYQLQRFVLLLEPIAMTFLSLLVGLVALGSLLPLYQLVSAPL